MESDFLWSFQPNLEMRATLTSFIFLKPRPPKDLERQRESQDLRVRFLALEGGKPHKKILE
jgi:hypothetical protein